MAEKLFHLLPGENIVHHRIGFVDPNAFVETTTTREVLRIAGGSKLKDPVPITLVLTDKDRFIIVAAGYPVDPVIFDRNSLPKIRDTGKVGKVCQIILGRYSRRSHFRIRIRSNPL